ncbi:hypothetical protein [Bradyrhizobium guangdongense]|uniref:hypothetical protein n=1 Tax=Bradyrhizobium guangdongense TaxID=1325090 RepID=UPI001642E4BC|nr:hypothetical protein [Bradyrhizobium guangdongense]
MTSSTPTGAPRFGFTMSIPCRRGGRISYLVDDLLQLLGSGWRRQSTRRQPLVDLAGNVDLPRFLQKLRAANARGHFPRLPAQTDCLLRQAVCECR